MKNIPKKTLVIIGNGFDLAHGLKSSYDHFFKDYIISSIDKSFNTGDQSYKDDLISVTCDRINEQSQQKIISKLESLNLVDIRTEVARLSYISLNFRGNFGRKIYSSFDKWVDIEAIYYDQLKQIINKRFKPEQNILLVDSKKEQIKKDLVEINTQMTLLTSLLETYLYYTCNRVEKNYALDYKFFLEHYQREDRSLQLWDMNGEEHEIHLLDFNYTNTSFEYENTGNHNIKVRINKIHGELRDKKNPIIFGFGDEKDNFYENIENVGLDEAFEKIKSFSYFKTENYSKLLDFIDSNDFTVVIVGHSCGLSDRILLSTIFEHKHCQKIRVCFYGDQYGENDYTSKTYQISRHFDDKVLMRSRIIPFDLDDRIPQYND